MAFAGSLFVDTAPSHWRDKVWHLSLSGHEHYPRNAPYPQQPGVPGTAGSRQAESWSAPASPRDVSKGESVSGRGVCVDTSLLAAVGRPSLPTFLWAGCSTPSVEHDEHEEYGILFEEQVLYRWVIFKFCGARFNEVFIRFWFRKLVEKNSRPEKFSPSVLLGTILITRPWILQLPVFPLSYTPRISMYVGRKVHKLLVGFYGYSTKWSLKEMPSLLMFRIKILRVAILNTL